MIVEQAVDASLEEVSIPTIGIIFKTTASQSYKDALNEVFGKADTSFNDEHKPQDNLLKTERTGWQIHDEYPDVFRPILDDFCSKLHNGLKQRCFDARQFNLGVQLMDSWIAKSQKGAIVEPHHHGLMPTCWSFCYYSEIPSGASSITFMDNTMSSKSVINVKENDLLWFPSSLTHYTVDTEEGRIIYSGNASISVDMQGQPPE